MIHGCGCCIAAMAEAASQGRRNDGDMQWNEDVVPPPSTIDDLGNSMKSRHKGPSPHKGHATGQDAVELGLG